MSWMILIATTASALDLASDRVAVGLHSDGSLVNDPEDLGLLWDQDGPGGAPVGGDFLTAGRAFEVWSATWTEGGVARTVACGGDEAPCAVEMAWDSPVDTASMTWVHGVGVANDVQFDLWVELPWGEDQFWMTMQITPLTAPIEGLAVAHVFDPDQDYARWGTYNATCEAGDGWGVAGSANGGAALALATIDGEGGLCSWCTTPSSVFGGSAGPSTSDTQVGVARELGDVDLVGVTVTWAWAFSLDPDAAIDLAEAGAADDDHDRDGSPVGEDCDDRDADRAPTLPEVSDGLDNDCDGVSDDGTAAFDDDGDGYTESGGDCDDADPTVFPGADPQDGVADADCDGYADEAPTDTADTGGAEDTGDTEDTEPTEDTAVTETDPTPPPVEDTGAVTLSGKGCGCASGGPGINGLGLLALGAVVVLRRRAAIGAALVLVGCAKAEDTAAPPAPTGSADADADTDTDADADTDTDTDTDTDGPIGDPVTVTVTARTGLVLDPKLDGAALDFDVTADGAAPCLFTVTASAASGRSTEVGVVDGAGSVRWSGRDADGVPFDPGLVTVTATAACGEQTGVASVEVAIVRLGPVRVDFTGPSDGTGGHVPLAYHKSDLITRDVQQITVPEWMNDRENAFQTSALDDDDGAPRSAPEAWSNPHMPPWRAPDLPEPGLGNHNVPAGYVAGSTPVLTISPGAVGTSAWSRVPVDAVPAGSPELRLVSPDLAEPAAWAPGVDVTVAAMPLPERVGKFDLVITWSWEARDATGAWVAIPGATVTSHPTYLLVDEPVLVDRPDKGSPAVPWIGVLDDVAEAIDGLPPDKFAVMDALRTHIHYDPYVEYNPGDGAYSDYNGPYIYWDEIWFRMTEWLDRHDGVDLYCHSVACLLSSTAGTVGIDAPYQTIAPGSGSFRTNLTQAAGDSDWLQWTFNSHGITGVWDADVLYVWDAAVNLDADAEPWAQPVTDLEPMSMTFDDYLDRLTTNSIGVVNTGHCYLE
jgi:MYXO-CTERM domain-containing protein